MNAEADQGSLIRSCVANRPQIPSAGADGCSLWTAMPLSARATIHDEMMPEQDDCLKSIIAAVKLINKYSYNNLNDAINYLYVQTILILAFRFQIRGR